MSIILVLIYIDCSVPLGNYVVIVITAMIILKLLISNLLLLLNQFLFIFFNLLKVSGFLFILV